MPTHRKGTPTQRKGTEAERCARIVAEAKQHQQGYRERALKLFPWICGSCAREFSLARLHELTVHHKDHNHNNNPADGSNWELLCIYCHDEAHGSSVDAGYYAEEAAEAHRAQAPSMKHNPFAELSGLLEKKKR